MNRLKVVAIGILVLVAVLLSTHVVSSSGVVPWFQISITPYNQSRPGLAANPSADQWLVVWEDFRGSGFGSDVYAQLVNGDGSLPGGNFAVISSADDWQRDPKPAYNPITDRYLVVWDDLSDTSDDVYGQQVNGNGSLSGSAFVVSAAANDQSNPEIAYNSSDNQFLVVFDDDRLAPTDLDIFGVLVDADGSVPGADFPISTPSEDQLLPVVAYNSSDNQFLVVWEDERNPGTSRDIYGRVVNADGSMAGPEFPIAASANDETTPDIAYAPASNRFLVVWEHGADIFGRVVRADASFVGPAFEIASSSGTVSDPAVGCDTHSGQFLVAWSDSVGWDDLYARQVDANGAMAEPEFDLATGTGDFFYPDMAFNDASNQFLLVWRHETCHSTFGCDDNDIDIFGAIYQATAHFGLHMPLILQDFTAPQVPTPTNTVIPPTDTPVTPSPSPTQTATPTNTPTPTATGSPDPWVTIKSEDFEGSFPGDWWVFDGDQEDPMDHHWARRSCRAYAGSHSGWAVGGGADGGALACGSNYPNDAVSWMIYGPFSLADATDAEMRFKAWVNTELDYDRLCRFASTDGNMFYGDCISGDSAGWIDQVLDLSNVADLGDLTGEPEVWVALWFSSDASVYYSEGAYVDDILVRKCTTGNCAGSSAARPVSDGPGLLTVPAGRSLDLP